MDYKFIVFNAARDNNLAQLKVSFEHIVRIANWGSTISPAHLGRPIGKLLDSYCDCC